MPEDRRRPTAARHAIVAAALGCIVAAYAAAAGVLGTGLTPSMIVDRQQGPKPFEGFRRAHTKGLCVEGTFVNGGGVSELSTARIFQDAETPFVGRYSTGGADPAAPDLRAGVRSIALDFRLSNGERWRTAMNVNPVLPVRDVAGFYQQLAAMAPAPGTGGPSAERLTAFYEAHPESAAFRVWQRGYRPPGSFALETYHGVNAFHLTDVAGRERGVRWRLVPLQADRDGAPECPDALQAELRRRLAGGPVRFRLEFVLAERDDPLDDPSRPWPDDRERRNAGTIEIRFASA